MTNLTSTLKLQHLFISNLLEAAQWIGVEKLEAQRKLRAAKIHLLAHFKLEDTLLYPVLFEAAEKNAELKYTLQFLEKDMAGVSKEVMNFFEQFHIGGTHHHTTQDLGNILFLLQTRIRREEDTLFAEFDKLKAAARTMVAVEATDSRLSIWASSRSIQPVQAATSPL
ncbi:MAG: hypothetical protein LZF62_360210 [Nitrospira sp.]|nr:MAG: hypothetical protein LZF62_360210 [Nitrospira sp.]